MNSVLVSTALRAALVQLVDLDRLGVDIGKKQAHAQGFFGGLFVGRGARQQQHLFGFARLGDKDLLTVDHVVVAVAFGKGRDLGRVGARVRFGDGERHVQLAAQDGRQVFLLGLLGAVFDERFQTENTQVNGRAGLRPAPALGDRLHDDGGFGNAQTAPPVFGRNRHPEPSSVGNRLIKVPRKLARLVPLAPVFVWKAGAQGAHLLSNLFVFFTELEIHDASSVYASFPSGLV